MYVSALSNIRGLVNNIYSQAQEGKVVSATPATKTSFVSRPEKETKPKQVEPYDPQQSILDSMMAIKSRPEFVPPVEETTQGYTAPSKFTNNGTVFSGYDDLVNLVDRTEAGGDYNALFGYSNRGDGPFASTSVSNMTIGELKKFSSTSGEYGQWVKGQIGRVATPMGRYQYVGTTLFDLAEEMGLSDDVVFSPETQDQIFAYHVKDLLGRRKTTAGKRNLLRKTWEGFKGVSDEELNSAIASFESQTSRIPEMRPERT